MAARPLAACSSSYPIWQVRSQTADPLYRFIKGDRAGYIDQAGKIVVEPTLEFYGNGGDEFENGLLLVDDGKFIDPTGKVAISKNYYRTWDFTDGLAAALAENDGKWGYIDRTGNFAISPRFEGYPNGYVHPFADGMAMIEVKDRYGYIDRTGEFVIRPKLLRGAAFSEGLARVVVEGPCAYIGDSDPCDLFNGVTLGTADSGQKAPFCKFAFIDKKGNFISGERFARAGSFSEGLAAVLKGGKWGFIDTKGEMVIAPQFDKMFDLFENDDFDFNAPAFSDGLALVKKGELWGYIDKTGKYVIEPRFKRAEAFHDGLAVVGKTWNEDEKEYEDYYYINKKGEPAFPETFVIGSHFFKGLAHVKLKTKTSKNENYHKGTFAYINTKGEKVFVYERKE